MSVEILPVMKFARSKKGIFVNRWKYVLDLLEETGLLGFMVAETLIEPNPKLLTRVEEIKEKKWYQRLVARLIYLSQTRSNIAYVASMVSQFMHAPRPTHFEAASRILRYLKGFLGKAFYSKRIITSK